MDFPRGIVPFILDDLGLHQLNSQQSADLYELIIARHRSVKEWLGIFDDPILGNSALDRMANASYQIVIEGASCRQRLCLTEGRC